MDPLGHDLLRERLAMLPELLAGMQRAPLERVSARSLTGRAFLVTGTGSSEAHARYLVHLLNRHARRPAEFMPLSGFCDMPADLGRGRVLVVISQGVSPNAQVAIDRHRAPQQIPVVRLTETQPRLEDVTDTPPIVTAQFTALDASIGSIQLRALARGCPSPEAASLLVRLAEGLERAI